MTPRVAAARVAGRRASRRLEGENLPPHELTRRELLKLIGGVGAGLAFGGPLVLPGCAPAVPGVIPLPTAPSTFSARVVAVRGRDLYEMTRRLIAGLGGMSTVVDPGDTVFIKPNFLTAGLPRPNHTITGEITKPEIVVAVAEECLIAGAGQVIIGDGAQVPRFDWEELVTLDGTSHLAAEAARLNAHYDGRVQLACLNSDSPDWDALPARRTSLSAIYASSLVTRADKVISIPVLKTHHIARLTLALKNFMGVTPIARYGGGSETIGRFALHATYGGPESAFLDVVEAIRPHLAVIDASIGCEGYGPWVGSKAGHTVDMRERLGDWLMLASTDLVAADATAARIVGQDYTTIPYLSNAYGQGLGQARADRIALDGATLDELRVEWEPARVASSPSDSVMK